MGMGIVRMACAAALAAIALPAAAQQTTTATAGERYEAGGIQKLFLGENYRPEWTTPIRVEVLDPQRFAGGLTVLQEGGGLSTESLRLRGADGREYVFRSVEKDVTPSMPPDLRGTLSQDIVQDLVSAKHPAAALVAPPLLEAVGVLHVVPRLYVMPDHPFLGEHRQQFAGRLGQVELRPTADDEDDAPDFAGAEDVEGSEDLREKMEEDPNHRVDAAGFLTARLMDVYLGDWDRHWDQWRWARFDRGGLRIWRPIPRDRDNALSNHEGLISSLARTVAPQVSRFGPTYYDVGGLVIHASELDRTLLAPLTREDWDSVAAFVRSRLTDRAIDEAVRRLPPEYYALRADRLAADLRARRERLPEAAAQYYRILAREAEVWATDAQESAEITRHDDGSVTVRIVTLAPAEKDDEEDEPEEGEDEGDETSEEQGEGNQGNRSSQNRQNQNRSSQGDRNPSGQSQGGGGGDDDEPDPIAQPLYFERRFVPGETREVRVFLRGGDDRASVSGASNENAVLVRVIGGGGDDSYADRSTAPGGRRTVFYDDRGDNTFEPGSEAKVDEREPQDVERTVLVGNAPPPRDWGREASFLTPYIEIPSNVGPVLGFGPTWTRWGFRRFPYASLTSLRVLWAPAEGGYGAEGFADIRHTNRPSRTQLRARGVTFGITRFHGYGNDTPDDPDRDAFEVEERQLLGQALYFVRPSRGLELYAGPSVVWVDPEIDAADARFAGDVRGDEEFGRYGAMAGARLDLRDSTVYPRNGARLFVDGVGYGSGVGTFARVDAEAAGYLSPLGAGPVLALRAGGSRALGDFPFQESAWVGGGGRLRGFHQGRYRGDTSLWGSAEVRQRVGRVNLLFVRPILGVYVLGDAGRVYVDGDSPGGWHTAWGGGLSFEALNRAISVSYARGEQNRLYVHLGMPF